MKALIRALVAPFGYLWISAHIIITLIGTVILVTEPPVYFIGRGVMEGIGGSLIASGVAGMTLFVYVVRTEGLKSRIEAFTKAGLTKVFSGRSILIKNEYDERLAKAERIDLVGFGLSAFRQDYADQFVPWSHRADVRILLIDPDFPSSETSLADQRDREENNPVGRIRTDVREFEKVVQGLSGLNKRRFKVRRFSAIPAINLFRIDDSIFWGPYLMGQQSRNSPTLVVTRGGFLFDTFEKHFEAMWDQSEAQN